jgi:hypothetical protein
MLIVKFMAIKKPFPSREMASIKTPDVKLFLNNFYACTYLKNMPTPLGNRHIWYSFFLLLVTH